MLYLNQNKVLTVLFGGIFFHIYKFFSCSYSNIKIRINFIECKISHR